MKPSPAFQFYPQDFLVGTADLTSEEVGGYIRLLCYQWAKGSLPNDDKKLMQLSGISDGLSLGNVSVKFRLCPDNLRRNDRLEAVRLEQEEYRRKQAENGQKGGNPNFKVGKKNPYYKPKDNPPDNPEHNPKINPSPSSSSYNKEEASNFKENGEMPNGAIKALMPKERSRPLNQSPALHVFRSKWCSMYQNVLGVPYAWNSRDDLATKSILSLPLTTEDLWEKIGLAWSNRSKFWCEKSVTVHGFFNNFNNISEEIKKGNGKPKAKLNVPSDEDLSKA